MKGNSLLQNLRYNSNSTQNQNAFEPTARDLSDNGSVNIEFTSELKTNSVEKQIQFCELLNKIT